MRKLAFAALVLGMSSGALAQSATPFKLVIAWAQGGVTVIDYPNAARCEAARKAVEAEAQRRIRAAEEHSVRYGTTTIGAPWVVYGFCIPG